MAEYLDKSGLDVLVEQIKNNFATKAELSNMDIDIDLKTINDESILGTGNITINTADCNNDAGFITSSGTAAKANQLTTGRNINGNVFNGSTDITNYTTCSTAAGTTAKTASISTGFTLKTGSQVRVKFSTVNTASAPTLNIQSTGAKRMSYKGSLITNANFTFNVNKIYTFTYDGTYWALEGDWDTVDISGKQDTISDLATIRSGASLGATAVQPSSLSTVATSGSYNDLSDKPNHFFNIDSWNSSTNEYIVSRMVASSTVPVNVGETVELFNTMSTDVVIDNQTKITFQMPGATTTCSITARGGSFTIKSLDTVSFVLIEDLLLSPVVPTVEGGSSSSVAETATKLATTRYINGTPFDGSADVNNYITCSTAAGTAAKTASLTGFKLATGSQVRVKFSSANTNTGTLSLNINSTGAKSMYYNGAAVTGANFPFDIDKIYTFTYDGTYWRIEGDWLNSVNAVSTNANYPVILGPPASAGASVSSGDKMLYTDSVNSLYYNPSTNTLSSPNIVSNGAISGGAYGVCSDTGTTTTKVVTLAGFSLVTGAKISVKFTNRQSTTLQTGLSLNVNSTGAKVIYYRGSVLDGNGVIFETGLIYDFVYDGTNWVLQGQWDNFSGGSGGETSVFYGICDTASKTVGKTVTVNNFTSYTAPHKLIIYFTNGTDGNISIMVNGLSQKRCFFNGRSNNFPLLAPGSYEFHYVNNSYEMAIPSKQKVVYLTGAQATAITINPYTHYRMSHSSGMTNVTISNEGFFYNEPYSLEIVTASSGCTITLPSSIKWANGSAPTWKANKLYQISIMNCCAVAAEFDIPSNFEYNDPNA